MKSLAERKKFRAAQRAEQLETAGVPNQDTGIDLGTEEPADYSEMTIPQLHEAAKGMGAEVPKEKTLKADILEFVENLAQFKAQESAEQKAAAENNGGSTAWKAGQ